MHITLQPSDSLVGSLCREIDRLRCRWRQVRADQAHCQEEGLGRRLAAELLQLQQRRLELQAAARELQSRGLNDRLGLDFLSELTSRPLAC
ncbi:MAG: hypothetical protein R6W06_02235 [Prochlorococcaceae cyanobacterium]